MPTNQVFALESSPGNSVIYIGTSNGAIRWDGNNADAFPRGSSWNLQPAQFFDFAIDSGISGGSIYAGTNIGVCQYSVATLGLNDCVNAQDGMPNWGVNAVGFNSTTIFGGTTNGVGLIDKSSLNVYDTWEAGTQTNSAMVEVIDDIAYIGLTGVGVARYDIPNNKWLPTWTESNVLDGGNGDVSGLVADFRPGQIWIGGADGFQLINVTTGAEVYDIEKTSSLWDFEMVTLTIYTSTETPYTITSSTLQIASLESILQTLHQNLHLMQGRKLMKMVAMYTAWR